MHTSSHAEERVGNSGFSMMRSDIPPGILEPEVILPAQYYSAASSTRNQPERRLMLAVLEDAVLTLLRHRGDKRSSARRQVREVERWIDAPATNWIFSFQNVCAVLGFNAAAVRQRLQSLGTERQCVDTRRIRIVGRRVAGRRHRVSMRRSHRRATNGAGTDTAGIYGESHAGQRAARRR
jgi:hypothetical protein